MLTIHRIPQTQVAAPGAPPLTRDSVISIARCSGGEPSNEVRIVVVIDCDDEEPAAGIEVASVELRLTPDGDWHLQYISHPLQSGGLTAAITPCKCDFTAYIEMRQKINSSCVLAPLCAEALEDEGLGPLASFNLRPDNPAPLVPSKMDLVLLEDLIRNASLA